MAPPIAMESPPPIVTNVTVDECGLSWTITLTNVTATEAWSNLRVAWRLEPAARGPMLQCMLEETSQEGVVTSTEDFRSLFVDTQIVSSTLIGARMWLGEVIAVVVGPGESRVFKGFAMPSCDLDFDGAIGPQDVAMLLAAWGTDEFQYDLDMDGIVGSGDLAMLLGGWNPSGGES